MEMGTQEKIEQLRPAGELYTCPECKYTDGFHVSFQQAAVPGPWKIMLICPQCHRRFRIGWKVDIEEN